jgi:hypothetical protein
MMNDDQYLLASAYADGEVTPAERALAEADPAVMAEVARLHALREALGEVEPLAAEARAAMIATALREFHAAAADVAPVRAPVVTHRRPARWFTWERTAGLAAAAVAVVAIGAVVANVDRGGDDDSADFADSAMSTEVGEATPQLDQPADENVTLEVAADTAAAASTEAPGVMAAPSEPSEPSDRTSESAADTVAADGTSSPVGAAGESSVIESLEELAAAGLALRDEYAAHPGEGDDTTTIVATRPDCTFTAAVESPLSVPEAEQLRDELPELAERVELLDLREYRVGPDDVRSALIAVDRDTGQAFAIDAVACALLAVGPLP